MDAVEGGGGLVDVVLAGGATKVLVPPDGLSDGGELLLFLRFDENLRFFKREVMSEEVARENALYEGEGRGGERCETDEGWAAGIQPWLVLFICGEVYDCMYLRVDETWAVLRLETDETAKQKLRNDASAVEEEAEWKEKRKRSEVCKCDAQG